MAFLSKIFGKKNKPEMEKLELPPLPPLQKSFDRPAERPFQPSIQQAPRFELPEFRQEPRIPTSRIEIKKTMPADITIPTGPPRVDTSTLRFHDSINMHDQGQAKPQARPQFFGERKPVLRKPSFMQGQMQNNAGQKPVMQPAPMHHDIFPAANKEKFSGAQNREQKPAMRPSQMHGAFHAAHQEGRAEYRELRPMHDHGDERRQQVMPAHVDPNKPLFIDVNDFRSILSNVNYVKDKLRESNDVLTKLNDTKLAEDKEFEKWRMGLEDIQRKMLYIDKALFEK